MSLQRREIGTRFDYWTDRMIQQEHRIEWLDYARFLAALSVFRAHYFVAEIRGGKITPIEPLKAAYLIFLERVQILDDHIYSCRKYRVQLSFRSA
jgi:hypothetical protein